jgi:hypothetical protein
MADPGGLGITDDTIARPFREVRPFRIYDVPPSCIAGASPGAYCGPERCLVTVADDVSFVALDDRDELKSAFPGLRPTKTGFFVGTVLQGTMFFGECDARAVHSVSYITALAGRIREDSRIEPVPSRRSSSLRRERHIAASQNRVSVSQWL